MSTLQHLRLIAVAAALLVVGRSTGHAAVQVVGGSDLLTGAYAAQLESWLGQGSITLTNIFDHAAGDGKTSYDFHAAANGQGPTITLIQVLSGTGYDTFGGSYNIGPQIIGGYNPQNWSSFGTYNYTFQDADRTAFLFNLTDGVKQDQKLSTHPSGVMGEYQTLNSVAYGPTFGGGHDLYVNTSLSGGYTANASYGAGLNTDGTSDDILIERPASGYGYGLDLSYGAIEVFTISPLATGVVPEPLSLAVWGGLACVAGAIARRAGASAPTFTRL